MRNKLKRLPKTKHSHLLTFHAQKSLSFGEGFRERLLSFGEGFRERLLSFGEGFRERLLSFGEGFRERLLFSSSPMF